MRHIIYFHMVGKDQEDGDFLKDLNRDSVQIIKNAVLEPSVSELKRGDVVQFERLGYFSVDPVDNDEADMKTSALKLNRVVTLKVCLL